jgi:hypothetical protein
MAVAIGDLGPLPLELYDLPEAVFLAGWLVKAGRLLTAFECWPAVRAEPLRWSTRVTVSPPLENGE